jgi:hypothetical protein
MVIVELPEGEAFTVVGVAVIVKSVGVKVTVAVCNREPLVPVTVTLVVVVKVQESVDTPDPGKLVGLRPHAALLTDKAMAPPKPFSAVTLIVDVAVFPFEVTEVGFALRAKSSTWKVVMAECVREPLVPVTVTVGLPAVA